MLGPQTGEGEKAVTVEESPATPQVCASQPCTRSETKYSFDTWFKTVFAALQH